MSINQNDAAASGLPIPRRAALASAAAFAAAMMWNPKAFGWEYCDNPTNQANVRGWSGTGNSYDYGSSGGQIIGDYSTLAYGLKCQTWTKWMHWNMGHGVGWLGTQMDLVSTTDFETELTYHIEYLPLTAGFSNSIRSQGWQVTEANDSSYSLGIMWKPDNTEHVPITSQFDMDTTEHSPFHVYQSSWLDEGHYDYWTDLQLWGSAWSLFPRRGVGADRELWARMRGAWWNFYHFGNYNCTVYGQTRWLTQFVPKVKITLSAEGLPTCGLEWAGRILNIRSYTNNEKCVFVGNSVDVAGNATGIGLWGGPEWTNRQWACMLNGGGTTDPASWSNTNRWTGTVSFANVMQVAEGSEAVWLDQYGGGPSTTKNIAGDVHTGNGSAAQAFWVHTGGAHQMVFSDASGHALARDYNKDDDGTTVMFWSDGDGKDLKDKGCWWVLDDARFKLRPDATLDTISTSEAGAVRDDGEICIGDTVSFPDLAPLTYPKIGYGKTSNLGYDYMWVAIDEADDGKWLDDQVEVWARAHVGGIGTLPVEQPAINFVGAKGLHALEGVHLRVKGSSLSGGIEYRFRNKSTGKWQDWVSGSADDDGTGSDAWAGEKGTSFRADGFAARLTGELAEKYTLFYEVGSGASGWSAWSKAGEDCIDAKSHFDAICVRILPKWANDAKYGFGASQNTMKVTDDMLGKKIVPVCRAYIKQSYIGLMYLGTVAGSADVPSVWYENVQLALRVDGEAYEPVPGKKLLFEEGVPIVVDPAWTDGAKKFGGRDETCSGFDGWYSDPECTKPWADGYVAPKGTKTVTIYARNKVVVDFKPSTHALAMMGGLALTNGEGNPASIADVPPAWSGWYGDKVTIPAPADTTLYAMDAGKKRTYTCTAGVYARDWDGSGTAPQLIPFGTHPVTSSGTRYYDWLDSPYDGFIGR